MAETNNNMAKQIDQMREGIAANPHAKEVNLTNAQIRAWLGKKLSVSELKAIAKQRAIPVRNSNADEIKRAILRNLERQEGYRRLAGS